MRSCSSASSFRFCAFASALSFCAWSLSCFRSSRFRFFSTCCQKNSKGTSHEDATVKIQYIDDTRLTLGGAEVPKAKTIYLTSSSSRCFSVAFASASACFNWRCSSSLHRVGAKSVKGRESMHAKNNNALVYLYIFYKNEVNKTSKHLNLLNI